MRLKISEIVSACGGTLLCGDENAVVTSFSADSRTVKNGTMFVPIKGEKTDAHDFLPAVFEAGAVAAFTEREIPVRDQAVVLVRDSRAALQKTAAMFRSRFDIPIIGVTGSAGKTTAKEMIALALQSKRKVLKTAGNQNSQIGVPLTVCGLRKEHQAAVVEMGVSMPGEMARIAAVVKPSYAVITNIGVSHIEYLKTQENILAEKLHIANYITGDGALFVNGDDPLLADLRKHYKGTLITFGVSRDCDALAFDINQAANGTFFTCRFRGEQKEVFVPAAGLHNVRNALASIAVAGTLGIGMEDAIRAIAAYKPPAMRQEMLRLGDVTVIDDSYNASPDSVRGAIDILLAEKPGGRKIAVLADMLELGDYSYIGHYEVGKYAAERGVDLLLGVGMLSKDICKGYGETAIWFEKNTGAGEYLAEHIKPGDTVLIKGSRSMKMDEIVTMLKGRLQG